MTTKPAKKKFHQLRRVFRWCRILVLLAILFAVIAGIYLNTIGLPEFLKRPLLAKLRDQGVQVDFDRMRLRWYRGIVVDDATFTLLKHPLRPRFSSAETELNFNWRSLRTSRLKLNSIAIQEAQFTWPVSETNQLALAFSNITTRVNFRSDDEIHLANFQADFADTRINISGSLTNASALRDWKLFQRKEPSDPKRSFEKLAATLEKIQLTGSPELSLNFTGDAADPRSFKGELKFIAPAADTPWGKGKQIQLTADLRDLANSAENNSIRLKASSAETLWGNASNLNLTAKLLPSATNQNALQTDLKISARKIHLDSGRAASVQISARTSLFFTNLIPSSASGKIHVVGADSKWGKAGSAEITFAIETNSAPKLADESWAAWSMAEPFALNWQASFSEIETPKIKVEKAFCVGTWRAPELQLSNLEVELYGGGVLASGELNVATRVASAKGSSNFDVLKISPLLTPFGQAWMAKYTWEMPPELSGDLRVILPAWTNRAPSWRAEVLPTLELNGHVSVGNGTYRDVTATSAQTSFTYSNMVWNLPHLRVDRPEGGADLNLMANDRTREYHWKINSQIDPNAFRHLLDEPVQRRFDEFKFTTPPIIRTEIRGRWNEFEKSFADGEILVKNFSFRGNHVDKLACSLQFTNQSLRASDVRLDQGERFVTAEKILFDLQNKKLFFTNVYSTVDPHPVARAIGPKVAAHVAPYQFAEPPTIRMNGYLTANDIDDVGLHFSIEGDHFKWTHFKMDRISGNLDWINETLLLTNVHAGAYRGGTIQGWSYFDFTPANGAELKFDFAGSDIDLQSLVSSIKGKTNHLEGLLHGSFKLDSGNTGDLKTWRGHGRANLRDGLIWDVPVFGIFSPVLNALLPGSGNSRAREGSAKFVVSDGIIYSDDLEIRAAGLRLQYHGAVDFQQRVDARVEAELLRDTWIIGRLVSLALMPISKIFEYQVTGTLSAPESEPVYIPNILMMTLRPFHSLKKVLVPEKTEPAPQPNSPGEAAP